MSIIPMPIKDESYISPTIRVSIGDIHLPFLTLFKLTRSKMYLCLHEKGKLPNTRIINTKEGSQHQGQCVFKRIPINHYNIILAGVRTHEECGGYHINPPSFLTGYCKARGVDLYKEGILEL